MKCLPSRRTLCFCWVVLAAIAVAVPFAFGGVNRWTSGGSLGWRVGSLAIDPMNPETVYAGTGRAVLKSRDGGASWTTSLEAPSSDEPFIAGLAIDPVSSSNVYAATNAGLFKSVDAGGNWKEVGPGSSDGRVYSLALDPFAPSTIFAGTGDGLFRSTDGGASWNGKLLAAKIYSLIFSHQEPSTALAIDRTGTRLHAGTDYGEVFSYQISSGALDLSVGADSKTRVLFTDPDSRAAVRSFDNLGKSAGNGPHGPYSG